MNPLFGILESSDYAVLAVFVLVAAALVASFAAPKQINVRRLERKLDALLQHHGIETPSRLSPEVQQMASDPRRKIAAIKMHRDQNPELSLAEAKADIEAFAREIR